MRYGGRIGTVALALSMIGAAAGAEAADVRSVYTDLTPAECRPPMSRRARPPTSLPENPF